MLGRIRSSHPSSKTRVSLAKSCRAWRPEMKLSSTPVVGVEEHDPVDARCSTRFSLKSIAGLFLQSQGFPIIASLISKTIENRKRDCA